MSHASSTRDGLIAVIFHSVHSEKVLLKFSQPIRVQKAHFYDCRSINSPKLNLFTPNQLELDFQNPQAGRLFGACCWPSPSSGALNVHCCLLMDALLWRDCCFGRLPRCYCCVSARLMLLPQNQTEQPCEQVQANKNHKYILVFQWNKL